MASSSQAIAVLILLNLALVFTSIVSTVSATCSDLSACADLLDLTATTVEKGSKVGTPCCKLLEGLAADVAKECLCTNIPNIKTPPSNNGVLGVLPAIFHLLGSLLNPLLRPGSSLDSQALLLLNACGFDISAYPAQVFAQILNPSSLIN